MKEGIGREWAFGERKKEREREEKSSPRQQNAACVTK